MSRWFMSFSGQLNNGTQIIGNVIREGKFNLDNTDELLRIIELIKKEEKLKVLVPIFFKKMRS